MPNRLARLLPDLALVFARFPVAVLVAVATFLWVTLDAVKSTNQDFLWFFGREHFNIGVAAFLAAGVGHLLAEGRGWPKAINFTLAFGLAALAAVAVRWPDAAQLNLAMFFPGLVLMLLMAAHLRRGVNQSALWLFDMRLSLAGLLAVIVGVVFGIGLAAILQGFHFLFGLDFGLNPYLHVWQAAITLVAPLYGLALVPRVLDEPVVVASGKGGLIERGVVVLVGYVAVPLVLAYAALLHAYAIKILQKWQLPHGEIGRTVSLFAIGGTLAWIFAWPWRETGSRLVQLFAKYWFWLLPVPALLLCLAIARRISDYGVTPSRYGIALVAVWTALVFAYLLLRRSFADIRVVVGGAAALLLAGSFGPWGSFGLTVHSQLVRLLPLLEEVGAMKGGVFQEGVRWNDPAKVDVVRSMLYVIGRAKGLDRVRAILPPSELPANSSTDIWAETAEIEKKLGLVRDSELVDQVQIYMSEKTVADVVVPPGGHLLGPISASNTSSVEAAAKTVAVLSEKGLALSAAGQTAFISTGDLAAKLSDLQKALKDTNQAPVLDVGNTFTLIITQAHARHGTVPYVSDMTFWLIVKP